MPLWQLCATATTTAAAAPQRDGFTRHKQNQMNIYKYIFLRIASQSKLDDALEEREIAYFQPTSSPQQQQKASLMV